MEKERFIAENGLRYERHGDYFLPCLTVPETQSEPIGRYARAHLRYLQRNQPSVVTEMNRKGTLAEYLPL